jgi:hypothetical protein
MYLGVFFLSCRVATSLNSQHRMVSPSIMSLLLGRSGDSWEGAYTHLSRSSSHPIYRAYQRDAPNHLLLGDVICNDEDKEEEEDDVGSDVKNVYGTLLPVLTNDQHTIKFHKLLRTGLHWTRKFFVFFL